VVWHIDDIANNADFVTPEDWQASVNNLY